MMSDLNLCTTTPWNKLYKQKQYLCNNICNKNSIQIQDFCNSVGELKNQLKLYSGGLVVHKFKSDIIMDIYNFAGNNSWEQCALICRFNPKVHDLLQMIELYDILEMAEDIYEGLDFLKKNSDKTKDNLMAKKGTKYPDPSPTIWSSKINNINQKS